MRITITVFCLLWNVLLSAQSGVMAKRLSAITSTDVELSYNGIVQHSIDNLILNRNKQTEKTLGFSRLYLSEIEDSLEAHNLPHELQYLIPTVSNYDNWKVSDDGGSGYWQLRYVTAKRYGLKISSYIDERRDYRKATSAAIPYFRALYKELGDWHAVIAAFISDPVEVKKAMRMAGSDSSYWDYHRFLPTQYQYVVPDFIASIYIHSYYSDHNLVPVEMKMPTLEHVDISEWVTIYQLSRALNIEFEDLKEYNAIYKKQVIPNTDKVYDVKIPFESVERFYDLGDSIYRFQSHEVKQGAVEPNVKENPNQAKVEEPAKVTAPKNSGPRLIYYTVRSGDYLGRIADLYDVRISDVRRWNNLRGDRIDINQRLKIYKSPAVYAKYNKINSMSAAQKNQLIKKD